jgi:acetyl esterase
MSGGTGLTTETIPVVSPAAPLDEFDPEVRPLVRNFRDNGSISFQDLPVDASRVAYRLSCAKNGLPPAETASVRDVSIESEERSIPVRLYRPLGSEPDHPLPCMMFIHGGGWVLGDLDTHDGICRFLANKTGGTVASVEYRLSPEHKYPAPLLDCSAVLSALVDQADDFGIDSRRIALAGDSAGANLAAVLALMSRDGTLPAITSQVLLYPVVDLAAESSSYPRVSEGVPLTARSMRWFKEQYLEHDTEPSFWMISPLRTKDLTGSAAAFIVTVGHDPLCDEGIGYASRLATAGVRVNHHHLPEHMHGLFTSGGIVSAAEPLLGSAAEFVRSAWNRNGRDLSRRPA